LFGGKLDLLDKLEKWEYIANIVGTVATLVEWGVRLLACAAPPAIGCLWNLVISALQAAFAMLLQTCWFTKKVYAPVMNRIDEVREFPKVLASEVVTAANKYLPIPDGMDPLFDPITVSHSLDDVKCEGDGGGEELTPEQEALLEMAEEIGTEKLKALLEFSVKRGAGPWLLLTAERLAELKGTLEHVTPEQLKAAANNPDAKIPVTLEQFAANAAKYSKQEKEAIRQNELKKEGGKGKGEGEGAKGGGGEDVSQPLDKPPDSRKMVDLTFHYFAVTSLPEALKPGGSYTKEIEIGLAVVVEEAGKVLGVAKIYPVLVNVKTVTADYTEFTSVKTFFATYGGTGWIRIQKDQKLSVLKDRLTNAAPGTK